MTRERHCKPVLLAWQQRVLSATTASPPEDHVCCLLKAAWTYLHFRPATKLWSTWWPWHMRPADEENIMYSYTSWKQQKIDSAWLNHLNQPFLVNPQWSSLQIDVTPNPSNSIKHLGLALVGLGARCLRFATLGTSAVEDLRVGEPHLSLFSIFLCGLCLCVCVCARGNWRARGACITSLHLPQNQGKLLDQSEQRQSLSVPGQGVQAGSPPDLPPKSPPHLSSPNKWWRDIDILSSLSYSIHRGYHPLFTSLKAPMRIAIQPTPPPKSWNDHVAQRWAAAAPPARVLALRRSPHYGHTWLRCPQRGQRGSRAVTRQWAPAGGSFLNQNFGQDIPLRCQVVGVPQTTAPNKLAHLMSSGFIHVYSKLYHWSELVLEVIRPQRNSAPGWSLHRAPDVAAAVPRGSRCQAHGGRAAARHSQWRWLLASQNSWDLTQ